MEIDYVVPMVFHEDHMWRENFVKVGSRYTESNPMEFVRYRSWGTEHLLIRCVKKFMPWVRNIYVLLAQESQKQAWMDEEGVRVVYHREFMPEWALPTFNSRAIEMFLKDIPGISDYFLYGNDDMFPVNMLTEEDFYVDGLPCLHHDEKKFPVAPNNFHLACMRGLNFVAKEFGKHYETTWFKGGHSITPMLKSTCEYLWERGGDEIRASISPFREIKNFNQYIYSWWHHLSGRYVDKMPRREYKGVKFPIADIVSSLLSDTQIVCVNDNECVDNYEEYGAAVIKALNLKLNN